MADACDEAAARALPCRIPESPCPDKWSPKDSHCDNCAARPAVAAEMRALVERAVAEERAENEWLRAILSFVRSTDRMHAEQDALRARGETEPECQRTVSFDPLGRPRGARGEKETTDAD